MAALKKNGEENWKKKVPKVEISSTPPIQKPPSRKSSFIENNGNNGNKLPLKTPLDPFKDNNGNEDDVNEVVLRQKKSRAGGKVGSLQDRLSQLQNAQNSWQAKVGEKDVEKFTVKGKMGSNQPLNARKVSEMNDKNDDLSKNRVKKVPRLRRFHGSPPPANDKSYDEVLNEDSNVIDVEDLVEVEVLNPDQDLDKFFSAKKTDQNDIIDDFDLDAISAPEASMNNLLVNKVRKPQKVGGNRRSRNPVKSLANRKDVKSNYHQTDKIGVVIMDDSSGKKSAVEKNVHSHLAAEAKAALAATEDFTSVQLKKDNKVVPHAEFVPYKQPGNRLCLL